MFLTIILFAAIFGALKTGQILFARKKRTSLSRTTIGPNTQPVASTKAPVTGSHRHQRLSEPMSRQGAVLPEPPPPCQPAQGEVDSGPIAAKKLPSDLFLFQSLPRQYQHRALPSVSRKHRAL